MSMFHQPCKFAFAKNKFAFTNLKNVKANVAKHQQVFPNSSSTFLFSSSRVEKSSYNFVLCNQSLKNKSYT